MEGVTCFRLPTHPLQHAIPDITVAVKKVALIKEPLSECVNDDVREIVEAELGIMCYHYNALCNNYYFYVEKVIYRIR